MVKDITSTLNKWGLTNNRVLELVVGLTANQVIVGAINIGIYPFVIYRFGILKGGVVMTFFSFIVCILTVWFYDWAQRDWLGIEAIKSLKEYEGSKLIGRLSKWVMGKSDPVVFLFLSIKYDPFITMIYMRHGAYNGMSARDWRIFSGSLLLSNAYWILACFMGISLVEWVWRKAAAIL